MFGFFLKKNFCDGWDNFFFIVASNAVTIFVFALAYIAFRFVGVLSPYLMALVFLVFSVLLAIVLFAWGENAARIADFRSASFGSFFSAFKSVWKIGAVFGLLVSAVLLLVRFAISYYLALYFAEESIVGLLMAAVLGWLVLVSAIAFQWFIPLYFLQGNNNFKKCLRKSFVIFFDNLGFSVAVFIYNILLFLLSCVFLLFVPGLNGILLSSTNALRLRLYKYDWFEKMGESDPSFENNRVKRNAVPWGELLAEDRESLGPRKLVSFIFPWKG